MQLKKKKHQISFLKYVKLFSLFSENVLDKL